MSRTETQNGAAGPQSAADAGLDRRIALWLFLGAFAVFAIIARGYIDNIDSQLQFATAGRLLDAGSLSLAGSPDGASRFNIKGLDGRPFMPYGPGSVLLYLPGTLLGRAAASGLHMSPEKASAFFASFMSPAVAAATLAALFLLFRNLARSRKESLLGACIVGSGTYVLHYGRSSYYDAALCGAVTASIALLASGTGRKRAILAGVVLATAASMKVAIVVLLPAYLVFLALDGTREKWKRMAAFLAPLAVVGLALLWWNAKRFGSALETGYGSHASFTSPLLRGVYLETFHPLGGWFWFCPLLLLAIPGMAALWRLRPPLVVFVVLAVTAMIVLVSKYSDPASRLPHLGGTAYGPRYLLPVTAISAIPACLWILNARGAWRWVAATVVAVSVAVQLPSVVLAHQDYWQVADAHTEAEQAKLPPPVIANFVLAKEKLLGRDDPWDLSSLGVAEPGRSLAPLYPALPGANVWWVRAARSYGRPGAAWGLVPLLALVALAAWKIRRAVRVESTTAAR